MRKNIVGLLIISLLVFLLAGCSSTKKVEEKDAKTPTPAESVSLDAAVLRGPTAVGMVKMMEDKPSLGAGGNVNYVLEQSPDVLTSKLLTGEIEIATIPTNVAAKIYNQGIPYQLAAMNTWGVMYVISNGVDIQKWTDLKGKEISATGKGAASDVVFHYLLEKNGVKPDKDVTLTYTPSPAELAQLTIAGKNKIAILPEPWVSTVLAKNKNVKLALDLQKEWTRINGTDVPFAQTCLVVNRDFASKHADIIAKFIEQYAASLDWVNKNTTQAGELVKKQNIGIPSDVTQAAIPRCNLRYASSQDSRKAVDKYLQTLLEFAPDSIGGKLPDENFYYKK